MNCSSCVNWCREVIYLFLKNSSFIVFYNPELAVTRRMFKVSGNCISEACLVVTFDQLMQEYLTPPLIPFWLSCLLRDSNKCRNSDITCCRKVCISTVFFFLNLSTSSFDPSTSLFSSNSISCLIATSVSLCIFKHWSVFTPVKFSYFRILLLPSDLWSYWVLIPLSSKIIKNYFLVTQKFLYLMYSRHICETIERVVCVSKPGY